MANALYDAFVNNQFSATAIDMDTDSQIKAALVSTGYTFSAAHDFWDDVNANVIGTPQALAGKSWSGRAFDANDVTFTAVAGGSTVKAIVIFKDTGTASSSNLIAYIDTATGLTLATNGGDKIGR